MARLVDAINDPIALEGAVRKALDAEGWKVEEQPVLESVRPDFLLSDASGACLVVEIKATRTPIHFGTIAQVERYARSAEAALGTKDVCGVLLTTAPLSSAARDAVDKAGILVLSRDDVEGDADNPEALATAWAHELGLIHRRRLRNDPEELSGSTAELSESLTSRERKIVELLTHEMTAKEIAMSLTLSESTVRSAIARIREKWAPADSHGSVAARPDTG